MREYLMEAKARAADEALIKILEEWNGCGFCDWEMLNAFSRYFFNADEKSEIVPLLENAAQLACKQSDN